MKNFILVFVMFIMTGVSYAGNEVYINQSGSGLDLDITLDGDGSFVGASDDVTYIKGADLDIIIDVDGTSEIRGDIYITGDSNRGSGGEEIGLTSQGAGVDYTLKIGATGDLSVNSSIIETRTNSGSSDGGTSTYTIGYTAAGVLTTGAGDYTDINVTLLGNDIDLNILENSTDNSTSDKKTTTIVMDTNSATADFDIDHTGAGNHDTILDINGSFASSSFTSNQSGAEDSIVNMIFDGASSSDIDVIITP